MSDSFVTPWTVAHRLLCPWDLPGKNSEMGTENVTVGWHHQFDGHEFEQALDVGDGEQSLACCSPRGHKELDTIE